MRPSYLIRMAAAVIALLIVTSALPATLAQAPVIETFEGAASTWAVTAATSGGGSVTRSDVTAAAGTYAARLSTASASGVAAVYSTFSDAASAHPWNERDGTLRWQRASVYVPGATINALGSGQYITLAGLYPADSAGSFGWYLRVGRAGALSVLGTRDWDGRQIAFNVFGELPLDQWVELEIGLHTQNAPGIQRSFAFLVDGSFYGWYRQGRLENETYNRSAFGIVSTNSAAPLTVYVDQMRQATSNRFPDGPDTRPTTALQEQDYRSQSGVMWQIDWTTWENNLTLHPQHGLYSQSSRLQSGRNLDRMPSLNSGWGEIEIGWPNGTPPRCTSTYCAAMIGFRKDVSREENLEIIPWADTSGTNFLVLEAWVGGGPQILARWQMPAAAAAPGLNVQEPGDIVRARWEEVSATDLNVRASYYDASARRWYNDIINHTFNATNVNGVNFFDGYHTASSVTIDSTSYSIRRFVVGTLATYGSTPDHTAAAPVPLAPAAGAILTTVPVFSWAAVPNAVRYEMAFDTVSPPVALAAQGAVTSYTPPGTLLPHVYYWRVRALDAAGTPSAWSSVRSLTVVSAASSAPVHNRYVRAPLLTWGRVSAAASYHLQIANRSSFSSTILDHQTPDNVTLAFQASALPIGVYYWRVRARYPSGVWGPWSQPDTFAVYTP